MALVTKVLAGSISSLSDARYYAGMGVEWLGFDVNPNSKSFVSPAVFKDITGWISGPLAVAQLPDGIETNAIQQIESDYNPDVLQCSLDDIRIVKEASSRKIMARLDLQSDRIRIDEIDRGVYCVVLRVGNAIKI